MKIGSRFPVLRQGAQRLFRRASFPSQTMVERAELIFYAEYLRQGMVAFDVGAHVGEITLLFSRLVGGNGHVHSFEATSETFERLQTVCRLVGRKNIVLNNAALAATEGIVHIYVYEGEYSSWNTLAKRPLHQYGIDVMPVRTDKIPAMTVDAYCERNSIERIDLLKIDVEGAEYQVLQGASSMLARKKVLCCVFEFGQTTFDMGNRPDEIEAYLRQFGYRVENIIKGSAVFPGRDNVKTAQFSMHVARPQR
jgi:FkbM family methyltransferase